MKFNGETLCKKSLINHMSIFNSRYEFLNKRSKINPIDAIVIHIQYSFTK